MPIGEQVEVCLLHDLESLSSAEVLELKNAERKSSESEHRLSLPPRGQVHDTRTPLLRLKIEGEMRVSGILCLGSNYLVIHRIVAKL